eukprot:GHVQ01006730.1.p1 GENE.GHVQ01006730.1~~GHVQ01006730.1.p1  ORF type:complete len:553 (-),score=92.13 GHVQ01006730.1:412-2070(-)
MSSVKTERISLAPPPASSIVLQKAKDKGQRTQCGVNPSRGIVSVGGVLVDGCSRIWPPCKFPIGCYKTPPTGSIKVTQFQALAAKRLAVLRLIDEKMSGGDATSAGQLYKYFSTSNSDEKASHTHIHELVCKLKEFGLCGGGDVADEEVCRNDDISHSILKIAYSQDKDKQDWFIRQECKLLSIKLAEIRVHTVKHLADSQVKQLVSGLRQTLLDHILLQFGIGSDKVESGGGTESDRETWDRTIEFRKEGAKLDVLFKVPFYPDACSLVRTRRVIVKHGVAYVPPEEMDSVIVSYLRRSLQLTMRFLERRESRLQREVFADERIGAFVRLLPQAYIGPAYGRAMDEEDEDRLTPSIINKAYTRSFPPCMRRLYHHLLKEHHLRHWGRQQLWMFLKGAGMNVDEQLALNRGLWQEPDKFDKEHKYNIRHMYGQEGKRANYTAYNCSKIVMSMPIPAAQDIHGCPFKTFAAEPLKKLMYEYGIGGRGVQNIVELSESRQPQLACVEYFKLLHPNSPADGVGNHPNAFYKESRHWLRKSAEQHEGAMGAPPSKQ